jgi:Flp pilus assembly protein TadG
MAARKPIVGLFARCRADARGAAAIEFVLILPVMLIIFFGSFEVSMLLRAYLTANRAAQLIANLVAQEGSNNQGGTPTAFSAADSTDYCTAAKLAMAPFPGGPVNSGPLKATIASFTANASGTPVADWASQDTVCGGGAGSLATTDVSGLIPTKGDSVIIVKIQYTYTASIHFVLPATYTITQTAYQRPRTNNTIPHS